MEFGWTTYPGMKEILLLCDSGGSNGYRPRLWKYSLYQTIARVHGLIITVCHCPPGASNVECIVMRSLPLTGRSSGSFRRLFTSHKSDAL